MARPNTQLDVQWNLQTPLGNSRLAVIERWFSLGGFDCQLCMLSESFPASNESWNFLLQLIQALKRLQCRDKLQLGFHDWAKYRNTIDSRGRTFLYYPMKDFPLLSMLILHVQLSNNFLLILGVAVRSGRLFSIATVVFRVLASPMSSLKVRAEVTCHVIFLNI